MNEHNWIKSKGYYSSYDRFVCSNCGAILDKGTSEFGVNYICYSPKFTKLNDENIVLDSNSWIKFHKEDRSFYDWSEEEEIEIRILSCNEVILKNIL